MVFNDTRDLFAETDIPKALPDDTPSTVPSASSVSTSVPMDAPVAKAPEPTPAPDIQVFDIEQAGAAELEVGKPTRLMIPSIKVDASIEEMGLINNGQLDAPKEGLNAGWFTGGPKPGEDGNAVIDGHLDLHGKPGVFWKLREVKEGDIIGVMDDQGALRNFKVTRTQFYDVETAPMKEIFGRNHEGKNLNLITCAGKWRKDLNHYDQRLVVFTEMME